jgi:hypothetical protein
LPFAADHHSAGYTVGTILADVLLIGVPLLLLFIGWRRDRQGKSADGWYAVGGALLLLVAIGIINRG